MGKFEDAFKQVCELAEDFRRNENQYLSPSYQEAEVRRDYIDKFFEALGWDIYHREQKNPYEQEVKVERGVSITAGKAQKRADYAFYISPEFRSPKFFVEAKKPSRNLKNPDDYFQTIRYGWNANTPVAVLTDFQEFHILDCRFKPDVEYVLLNQNHKSYGYNQYSDIEKFKEIYYLFSRSEVESGSLEKYSESLSKPKGKSAQKGIFPATAKPIDEDFLEYIDDVRETLAKAFKRNDASLTSEQLTEVTQKTVDRLVFIRFLEDKLIEPEYYISELGRKSNPWKEFVSLCRKLDAKYNGIVFKETVIDKQTFKGPDETEFLSICDGISRINSPYDFHYIPIHILGSIYERFLGKIVTLKGRGIKIEEKPEVRKAGGVYYTPKYIVDYIVKNTVGKLIENKTPEEISKLRFADIACGSGSFLIGVYEHLLEYHKAYYQSRRKQAEKDGCIDVNGIMTLSLRQKQEILLNNIYGVDIDHQAVEVTQLSLALKMLEDETTYTTRQMQMDFRKKIIPGQLSKNIVCGNSLIGTDILSGNMFAGDEERKLNTLDFETAFPEVMRSGGFDAIVGNPPYVRIQTLNEFANEQVLYFNDFYNNIVSDSYDIYLLFIYKGYELLNKKGVLGFITPHKFFTALMGKKIREYLYFNKSISKIVDFTTNQIFEGATTYTCLLFLKKEEINKFEYKKYSLGSDTSELNEKGYTLFDTESLNSKVWSFVNIETSKILNKISKNELLFDRITSKIFKGSSTGNDDIYLLDLLEPKENSSLYFSKTLNSNIEIENQLMKKFVYGEDIKKYCITFKNTFLLFPYDNENGLYKLIDKKNLEAHFPKAYNYLISNKSTLLNRKVNLTSNSFFKYSAARSLNEYQNRKILVPDMLVSNRISIDLIGDIFHGPAVHSIIFNEKVSEYNALYFLGILNSKVFWFYISNTSTALRGNAFRLTPEYLKDFCFPKLNFQNPSEKQSHDLIVSLVDQMLDAKKKLHEFKTEKDKTYYERKCESLDRQIDSEVYKLYGLTEEEINIVESKN